MGTPPLTTLNSYDSVLAYTNNVPSNPVALGDTLANYVDAGGHLVLATYSYSNPWAVDGRITTSGYAPLTNVGVNGDVSGDLNILIPGDPIFNGIDPNAVIYFHNGNFAHPGLDVGATLLATDGAGINLIALNSNQNVVGFNLFPGSGNNQEFYNLLGNALLPRQDQQVIPEPTSLAVFGLATVAGGFYLRRRKRAVA